MEDMMLDEVCTHYQRGQRVFRDLTIRGNGTQQVQLPGLLLEHVTLHETHLVGGSLRGATFRDATIEFAHLEETDMSQVLLQNVTIRFSTFHSVNFSQADLQEIRLEALDLEGSRFQDANLYHAQLQHAKLRDAQFQRANLTAANLRGADIRGVNFDFALLRDTILQQVQRDETTSFQHVRYRSRVLADPDLLQALHQKEASDTTPEQQRVVLYGKN